MNIGMVLGQPFPPDVRVEKEARILASAGHRVFLLAKDRKHPSRKERLEDITVFRVPFGDSEAMHRLGDWRFRLTFVNTAMKKEIERFIKTCEIDVLHVHDLPLVKTALEAATSSGVPTVADLHENFAAGLQVWETGEGALHRLLFNRYSRWHAHESKVLRQVQQIIVVVEAAKERLIEDGIPSDKVSVVTNAEPAEFASSAEMFRDVIDHYKPYFVISYMGSYLGSHRGLDRVVEAMPRIRAEIPEALLLIVGWGAPEYEKALREKVKTLGIEQSVEFVARQPSNRMASYLSVSDVSLVPHESNPHTETTIPHKLFQAMLMGVPVVVSSCRPLRGVVEKARCGIVFEAGSASSLAEAVVSIYKDKRSALVLGENGRNAARHYFEEMARALKSVYRAGIA
jgi:glycosyltransferase involved in cell wall biosynthesis